MGVLADIRAVSKPVNTIVDDNGRNNPKRYASQCLLELVFNRYKSDECLDKTEGTFSLTGSELIKFVSTVLLPAVCCVKHGKPGFWKRYHTAYC